MLCFVLWRLYYQLSIDPRDSFAHICQGCFTDWDSRVICEIDQRKATTNQNQTLTVCMHFSVMYVSCRGPVRFTCSDPVACRHHLSGAHLRISQVLNYI